MSLPEGKAEMPAVGWVMRVMSSDWRLVRDMGLVGLFGWSLVVFFVYYLSSLFLEEMVARGIYDIPLHDVAVGSRVGWTAGALSTLAY